MKIYQNNLKIITTDNTEDYTIDNLKDQLNVRFTFKKLSTRSSSVDSKILGFVRREFVRKLVGILKEDHIVASIDESTFSNKLNNCYGWAKRGTTREMFHKTTQTQTNFEGFFDRTK